MADQPMLRFGTDGWRTTWPDNFTLENVRRVAAAVAHVMPPSGNPAFVVGHDTRHLSAEAAEAAAETLARHGFRVHRAAAPAPTPAVAFAVRRLGAAGAVMITASHNPPRYNGLKVFGPRGESVAHAVCRRIEAAIDGPEPEGAQAGTPAGSVTEFDPCPDYLAHLDTLLDRARLASGGGRVVVDSMHGAGGGFVAAWLRGLPWQVDEIRAVPDPDFGGGRPEPIMPHLQPLVDAVRAGRYVAGLAHDGDADRIGAVDETGAFISPQVIFPLVLRYLVERRGWRGKVAKTVSTTGLVDRLCKRHDLPVIETPVGFHDISTVLLDQDGLMGGEESGGMSLRGHVPQGDGILLGLLLLEAVTAAGTTLGGLVADLMRDLGPVYYNRCDINLERPLDKKAVVAQLVDGAPATLAGLRVCQVTSADGVKYHLEDDSWLLIRPSGTEPVLRVYAEARNPGLVDALCAAGDAAVMR